MLSRRTLTCALFAFGVSLWVRQATTQAVEVPIRLQAELLAKVAAYDRGLAARARGHVLVLVAVKAGDPESERVGEQLIAELSVLESIGGLPHSREVVRTTTARALADLVKARSAAIVYLSARLGEQLGPIADALDGVSVLSVGVSSAYVSQRAVLGFDIDSGKPKLVVHLGQARRQQVAFKPELLALARVIQ
jgi:YfiR/HmsC-like